MLRLSIREGCIRRSQHQPTCTTTLRGSTRQHVRQHFAANIKHPPIIILVSVFAFLCFHFFLRFLDTRRSRGWKPRVRGKKVRYCVISKSNIGIRNCYPIDPLGIGHKESTIMKIMTITQSLNFCPHHQIRVFLWTSSFGHSSLETIGKNCFLLKESDLSEIESPRVDRWVYWHWPENIL